MSTHGKSDPGQRVVSSGHPQLAAEAAALTRLHEASARLWNFRDVSEGLEEILAASIDLLGADKGNVQLLDGERRVLQIAVQRGFAQDFLDFFREVSAEDDSACGRALRFGERVVIEDIEADPEFAPLRPIARASGFRAVQSTPSWAGTANRWVCCRRISGLCIGRPSKTCAGSTSTRGRPRISSNAPEWKRRCASARGSRRQLRSWAS